MNSTNLFDNRNSLKLYELSENFNFLKNLYESDKLPKVTMLSGLKGIGKSTLINHLIFYIFDKENYDMQNFYLHTKSPFYKQFKENVSPNVIYLNGSDFENIKIMDIRNLKKILLQTNISKKKRYIILDDIEVFNINSLNALLKIIEEPNESNFFFLINNNTKILLETLRSRCIEIKILLNESQKRKIISSLLQYYNQELYIDLDLARTTPGNFLKYNYTFRNIKIDFQNNFLNNLIILLDEYKKNKNFFYINIIKFYIDYHFEYLNQKKRSSKKIEELDKKILILTNLEIFFKHNLNQNNLINSLKQII